MVFRVAIFVVATFVVVKLQIMLFACAAWLQAYIATFNISIGDSIFVSVLDVCNVFVTLYITVVLRVVLPLSDRVEATEMRDVGEVLP